MELLTILLLLVFLLEEGLKLALLSLKFLKRLGKIRKQFREEKMPESSHTRSGGPNPTSRTALGLSDTSNKQASFFY